jgi:hypothetical protein
MAAAARLRLVDAAVELLYGYLAEREEGCMQIRRIFGSHASEKGLDQVLRHARVQLFGSLAAQPPNHIDQFLRSTLHCQYSVTRACGHQFVPFDSTGCSSVLGSARCRTGSL